VIHAQFTRRDQFDRYVKYRIRPSLCTLHTYYFDDALLTNGGAVRQEGTRIYAAK
jgi:predicted amidohydrolase YtcJ